MGKYEVAQALKALGGTATGPEIKEWLRKKYPNTSMADMYDISVNRLIKDGTVTAEQLKDVKWKPWRYKLVGDIERNVVILDSKGNVRRVKQ